MPNKLDATVTARARAEFPPASWIGIVLSQWRERKRNSYAQNIDLGIYQTEYVSEGNTTW